MFRSYAFLFLCLIVCFMACGCQRIQQVIAPEPPEKHEVSDDGKGVINVGFYAYFAPVSYSADPDPASDGFNTHLGYEADLLTALEAMNGTGPSFSRSGIAEWPGIWLKAAEPEYDLIGGGITILDSRTQDTTGKQSVAFTSGHIKFRQSLLVRSEDANRLSNYASLTRDVRVGVLSGTTGEARLLEITGIVNTDGVLVNGTRIETPAGSVVADGTQQYSITAAGSAPSLAGRQTLYPPTENMPQVIYLGDDVGESALFEALTDGRIDAIARGEIGNRDTAAATHGAFVVTALDDQVEYGGFTLAVADVALRASLNARIDYLTDGGNIGYAEWLADPQIFFKRAQARTSRQ